MKNILLWHYIFVLKLGFFCRRWHDISSIRFCFSDRLYHSFSSIFSFGFFLQIVLSLFLPSCFFSLILTILRQGCFQKIGQQIFFNDVKHFKIFIYLLSKPQFQLQMKLKLDHDCMRGSLYISLNWFTKYYFLLFRLLPKILRSEGLRVRTRRPCSSL